MALPQLIAELDDEALSQLFSNGTIAKGRGYVGRVRRIEVAGHPLSASVQGGEPQPYRSAVRPAKCWCGTRRAGSGRIAVTVGPAPMSPASTLSLLKSSRPRRRFLYGVEPARSTSRVRLLVLAVGNRTSPAM